MIARTWQGTLDAARVDEYLQYVQQTGVKDLRKTPGNRGVLMMIDRTGPVAQLKMISFWDSIDSIRAFAGDDVLKARYYQRDRDFLHVLEPRVQHLEVTDAEGPLFA